MSSIDWGLVCKATKQGKLNTLLDCIPCEHWNDTQDIYSRWTLLHFACYSDDSVAAIRLLENGANLSFHNPSCVSPMFVALKKRNFKIFHVICKTAKVNVNTVFGNGMTLCHSAAIGCSWDILEMLCALGANIQANCFFKKIISDEIR